MFPTYSLISYPFFRESDVLIFSKTSDHSGLVSHFPNCWMAEELFLFSQKTNKTVPTAAAVDTHNFSTSRDFFWMWKAQKNPLVGFPLVTDKLFYFFPKQCIVFRLSQNDKKKKLRECSNKMFDQFVTVTWSRAFWNLFLYSTLHWCR